MTNVQGIGPKDAKIMIVGDYPSSQELSSGKPLENQGGGELRQAFRDLGLEYKQTYRTLAVKYKPEKKVNAQDMRQSQPDLEDEVGLVKPNVILALGAVPLQMLTGKTGITKVRGQVVEVEIQGHKCLVLPTYSPTAVYLNPEQRPDWESDIGKLLQYQDMTELPKRETRYITTWKFGQVKKVLNQWKTKKLYAYDLETKGTDPWNPIAKILCISVSWKVGTGYTIPLSHRETPFNYTQLEYIRKKLKRILERQDTVKVAHNGKFDNKWLRKMYGIRCSGDWLMLEDYIKFAPTVDTMLMHHLLDSSGAHGLKPLSSKLLGMEDYDSKLKEYLKTEEVEDNGELDYEKPPAEILFEYAAADVDATLQLYLKFSEEIRQNPNLDWILSNVTNPINEVLTDMEFTGAPVNVPYLMKLGKELEQEIKEYSEEVMNFEEALQFAYERKVRAHIVYILNAYMEHFQEEISKLLGLSTSLKRADFVKEASKCVKYKKAGTLKERRTLEKAYKFMRPYAVEFLKKGKLKGLVTKSRKRIPAEDSKEMVVNLQSSDQLQELLFDPEFFGLPTPTDFEGEPMLTDAGNPSTDKEALAMLEGEEHGIAGVMLKLRTAQKHFGTFYKGIKEKLDDQGRIHANFNIHGTASGRLSSSKPNLQQVPRDKRIKNVFAAGEGKVLVQADFSQAELRTAAILSNDANMKQSYIQGIDLHRRTAARTKVIQGIDKELNMDGVTGDERQDAKISNFGIIYGRTDVGLSKELKIALALANDYINAIFVEYSNLKKWIDRTQKKAKREGLSESMFGRVRWLPAAKLGKGSSQSEALRQSVNHAVQSTASDITLLNLIRLYIVFKELELDAKLIITVHDSIIVECVKEHVDDVCVVMKEVMQTPVADWVDIPFEADVEFGPSWGNLKPHYENIECPYCKEKKGLHIRHTTQEAYCEECEKEVRYSRVVEWMDHVKESKKNKKDPTPLSRFLRPGKKKKSLSAADRVKKRKVVRSRQTG